MLTFDPPTRTSPPSCHFITGWQPGVLGLARPVFCRKAARPLSERRGGWDACREHIDELYRLFNFAQWGAFDPEPEPEEES